MPLSLRQSEILEIAKRDGRVLVEDLAQRFEVTLQTIRRDLGELCAEGRLERVHGGAMLPSGVANIGYEERRGMNAGAKAAIARACARDIPDNVSLFLNIGTTTEAVARALLQHRNLTVVTNNINVANILAANDSCEVIVSGGVLRRADGGLVGDLAARAIAAFKVDYAIIGASALDRDGELLDFDLQEVRVSQEIIAQSRRAYLVTDSSKLMRSAPVRIASLSALDAIYTDRLPADLRRACAEWDTRVVLAEAGPVTLEV